MWAVPTLPRGEMFIQRVKNDESSVKRGYGMYQKIRALSKRGRGFSPLTWRV